MTTLAQEAPRRNRSRSNADDVEPILIAEWPIKRGEIARVSIENYKGSITVTTWERPRTL